MIKINALRHDKLWGHEIWLHSPLPGQETVDEWGIKTSAGPLLKIIKTSMPLSIQVHPDDKLAQELEHQANGKSESWYVLGSHPAGELVAGINIFDEKVIRQALQDQTFPNLLKKIKPRAGEFYNIPAGLVHGIGAGITIFELQQPSDVTYRYYDYNRRNARGDYRKLHIEKAIKAQKDLNYKLQPLSNKPLTYHNQVAIQEFYHQPSTLKHDALVVDFKQQICYQAVKGEQINFQHYVVVHGF